RARTASSPGRRGGSPSPIGYTHHVASSSVRVPPVPPRAILHPPPSGRSPMAIRLDHLIVPSPDPLAAARLLAGLLGVPWEESRGGFTPVYVNETLTLDFADRDPIESHHVCFHVGDDEFDAIFGRIKAAGITYRSRPHGEDDMQIK